MFATQLLRILQAAPSDVKCDTCVCDSSAQDMIMKENHSDPLSKDTYQLNGLKTDTHPPLFEEVYWNPKFNLNQNRNGPLKPEEFQNGPICRLEDDKDSVSSESNAKDQEHDCAVAGEDFVHSNENESSDCLSPSVVAASDLYGRDENWYTDKNVLECQRPQLIVCYKEINYHVVKDICVDEGMLANRKILIDNSEDDQSGISFPHPANDPNHRKATGSVGDQVLAPLDDTDSAVADQQGSRNESNGISPVPKLPSEISSYNDTVTGCNLEESIQNDGMNSVATSKTATDEGSFVDKSLPIQEFGTRSFLRSFLSAFDADGNEIQPLPDQQLCSGKARPKEDVQASSLKYNSEVQRRSITFNFNSLAGAAAVTNGKTQPIEEHSVDSIDQNNAESHQPLKDDAFPNDFSTQDSSSNENEAAVSLRRYDPGESSFSADSFITHSGPIAFSGNVSLRSDGSATSGRSFAFPVLQSEWNCSPVRMTEADRRRFRRHRGWRSGLLCCRF